MPGYDRNYNGTPRKGNHNNRKHKVITETRGYKDCSDKEDGCIMQLSPREKRMMLVPEDDEGPFMLSPFEKTTIEMIREKDKKKAELKEKKKAELRKKEEAELKKKRSLWANRDNEDQASDSSEDDSQVNAPEDVDPDREQRRQTFLLENENTEDKKKKTQTHDSKKSRKAKGKTKIETSKQQQTQEVAIAIREENNKDEDDINTEESEAETTEETAEENKEANDEQEGRLATIDEGEVEEPESSEEEDSNEEEDVQEIEKIPKGGPSIEEVTGTEEDERRKAAEEKQRKKEELLELKRQVLQTGDDTDEIRSPAAEKAILLLTIMQRIQHGCGRLTIALNKEMDDCAEALMNQILEMELQYQVKKTQLETMESHIQARKENGIEETRGANNRGVETTVTQTRPAKDYAEAVKVASSTLIIQAKPNTDAEELEKQIIETTKKHHNMVKRTRKTRRGLRLTCENEEQAAKLAEELNRDETVKATAKVTTADVKKKSIIIFKIPEYVKEEQVKQKIVNELQLDRRGGNEAVTLLRLVRSRGGWKNQQVLLPELLADRLLRARSVCLGLRECPIRTFVKVTRCHRCLEFDHIAANCDGTQRCSICAGPHLYTECKSPHRRCHACSRYNEENRGWAVSYRNTNHQANSPECRTYQSLFRIRQIQSESGMAQATGHDVITGRVKITSTGGVERVTWLPRHDQQVRKKDAQQWQRARK